MDWKVDGRKSASRHEPSVSDLPLGLRFLMLPELRLGVLVVGLSFSRAPVMAMVTTKSIDEQLQPGMLRARASSPDSVAAPPFLRTTTNPVTVARQYVTLFSEAVLHRSSSSRSDGRATPHTSACSCKHWRWSSETRDAGRPARPPFRNGPALLASGQTSSPRKVSSFPKVAPLLCRRKQPEVALRQPRRSRNRSR